MRARTRSRCPCASSSAQRAAVRRSCQTIALPYGSPVVRSQATTVSRWLVMPIAATCSAPTLVDDLVERGHHRRPDLGGVVLDPARVGKYCVNSRYAATGGRSSANTARLRTPVVPASMAITHVRLVTAVTVSAGRRACSAAAVAGPVRAPPAGRAARRCRTLTRRAGLGRVAFEVEVGRDRHCPHGRRARLATASSTCAGSRTWRGPNRTPGTADR